MATNLKMSSAAVNAEANALASLATDGYLRLYDGTQPTSADTAISTQTQLAELRLGNPAFDSAVAGVINTTAIASDPDADATGTASWFRIYESDGITPLWDGSVGTASCNININSVNIQQHAVVSISAYQHRVPK